MGKLLIQQRRGKGSQRYKSPTGKFAGKLSIIKNKDKNVVGYVKDIIKCPGHYAPLAIINYDENESTLIPAFEGMKLGDTISAGPQAQMSRGNILILKNIPEGTQVYNIESQPGDGGKFCRSSGTFGRVTTKTEKSVTIILPSKKEKMFCPDCRAIIGNVAGSGRCEKPVVKAGKKYFAKRARNKNWPSVSGNSMNAVDHPFGGSSSNRNKIARQASRHAPPGRKVGSLAPRKTGKKR